ncbi:MAG: histidine phosphatase family protein [Proteobacteria bacterium]|nr:histidine phosphatase family protein [Pseudomonadota bacterium]
MKHLQILRHAKSSWRDVTLSDHDRPLNKRGKKAAPIMGKLLAGKAWHPQLIISSTAKRAYITAKIIAQEIHYDDNTICVTRDVYHASAVELLALIAQVNNDVARLMLVGHNPGLTSLANNLCDNNHYFANIPTAGLVTLELDIDSWGQILRPTIADNVVLVGYDYPKSLTQIPI